MNSQFKRGIIEMCVIKIISRKDMYGFELIENISQEIEVNENTIYPILRRLTKQGLFDTYTESMSIGAPRKYYTLTEHGTEKLKEYEDEWKTFLDSVSRILGSAK
jgi:PadR family transcriptional regulator PadR